MDSDLTTDLARRIVVVAAPDELALFEVLAAGTKASGRHPDRRSSRERALNSGLSETVQVITPVVIYIAGKIIELVLEAAIKKSGKQASRWWPLRKRIAAVDVDEALVLIGPEQRSLVHSCAVESAMEYGLTREDAEQLAAKVVSVVVRGNGETGQAG